MAKTSSCNNGPGYSSPMQAFHNGPKETVLYVTCIGTDPSKQFDYLATIDVDNQSRTYGQVIHRTYMTNLGDELHHSGWNTCSSCYGDCGRIRNRLILPCLNSSRVYILSVDGPKTQIVHVIEPEELAKFNVSAPHTSHCLPSGHVMLSCMGDSNGQSLGSFLLLDETTFKPKSLWNRQSTKFGYDFWYQPRLDIMISTEWSAPNTFRKGFFSNEPIDTQLTELYGQSIHLWQFSTGHLLNSFNLQQATGQEALMPLEVRMLHNPESCIGFVGCAFTSNVFRFQYQKQNNDLKIEEVIKIESKKVDGFKYGHSLPALITDIIISMDDRFLYVSAFAFGEIRQYDQITGTLPRLKQKVRIGGLLSPIYGIRLMEQNDEPDASQIHYQIKNCHLRGGAQMLQLSLDGRRLFATNSLFSAWDRQFYPQMLEHGSQMVKIDIKDDKMTVDENFIIDFGQEPTGPVLAHEMRYPGGDCTSDIWI